MGNYLALIWLPKPFSCGFFGFDHMRGLFGRGDYLSRGLFGFSFIAPRIGTLQLLQLYETDANDVTMAMIIFMRLPNVSISRNQVRSSCSSFLFGFI